MEVWYGASAGGTSGWSVAPVANRASCDNPTLGDPRPGIAKACYYRPYTGSWTPTFSAPVLNTDGFFYGRVQVCNSSAAGLLQDTRDYGLCTQYPNGNYKPIGAIQKYGEQMRLAAFGYLMDQAQSRVGGVLRAPMKFVGAKTFDINGLDNTPITGNPKAEWNSNTGVFASNPDNDTTQSTPISGVINYLNKFGRTGPVPGRYKIYDHIGELHYEALRYLQGLQPTDGAVAGAESSTSPMWDGFPLFTTWTDPYGDGRSEFANYSCLKSNIVTIGDIHTADSNQFPDPSEANNYVDINLWRSVVQAFEKNQSVSYRDGQGTGLINFQPVFGNAAEVTQVYMGDLHGNLWKLDFSLHGAAEWTMNKLSAYNKGTVASPQPYPLYIAKTGGASATNQPISMAPSVIAGPLVGGVRTTYVAFATGKYLETSDNTIATTANSLYVIYDNGSTAADSSPAANSVISSRNRLQGGSINATTGAVTVPAFTWGRAASDTDATQRSGWMIDFAGAGERVVNNATIAGDNLIFGSLIPVTASAAGPCPQAGGGGKSYVINIDSGQGGSTNSVVGLLGEPLVLEIVSATSYTTSATTGRRVKTVVRQVVQQGSSGVTASETVTNTLTTGRLSWRQINNYLNQKNAP